MGYGNHGLSSATLRKFQREAYRSFSATSKLGHGIDCLAFRHFDIELPQSIGDRAGCAIAQNVAIDFNDG